MGDQSEKPQAFRPGATTISAGELNKLRAAIPRLLKGGGGIIVEKYGDRYIIRLAGKQGTAPGEAAIVTIVSIEDDYLVCDKDGAVVNVAKPPLLRGGGGDYQVDDELLAVRLPSARIEDLNGNLIRWIDGTAGQGGAGGDLRSADAASTANQGTLSGLAQTIDGVALNTEGMRVLLKNQTTAADNGLYEVLTGTWENLGQPDVVAVKKGTVNKKVQFILDAANTYSGMGSFDL